METFTKGDIVIFPFPYTDLSERKVRPCLVISDEMDEDVILCQITSQKVKRDTYAVEIKAGETREGSLAIDSFVRCNMIFTASKQQIIKRICKINEGKYSQIISTISKIIK
ncbi:type II toxin-antitoxin system PemK/MazF family toxin [Candidatus Woesearchaeota archaeon]|nr:type II toxin-antitoxin system PemK/MazF family toxin [Candidatus Woesearchaeota archaeon]